MARLRCLLEMIESEHTAFCVLEVRRNYVAEEVSERGSLDLLMIVRNEIAAITVLLI